MTSSRRYEIDPGWEAVLRADPCAYCGAPTRDLDHIVAVAQGGSDDAGNLTSSCGRCNKSKHDDSLLIFLWKQTVAQAPPPTSPRAGVVWRKDIRRWAAYVDVVRRHQLGHFDDDQAAVTAVEAWWKANPDAMSPRARRKLERTETVQRLWAQGLTM